MAKLKLVANPTFKANVGIPVAGGESVPVEFTFKHRTKTALDEWVKTRNAGSVGRSFREVVSLWDKAGTLKKESAEALAAALDDFILRNPSPSEAESFMDMVIGWELEDEFTKENVETFLENYGGASLATFKVYLDELVKAKLGN